MSRGLDLIAFIFLFIFHLFLIWFVLGRLTGCGPPRDPTTRIVVSACHVQPDPQGARIKCDDGTETLVHDGAPGVTGPAGPRGEMGFPGNSGSVVTAVLPCPSVGGSFPEVLLCIDAALFAVYDGHVSGQVHYTEVVPGAYHTTDGRSCNFTVVQGCEVQ